jgi:hypothetical protein
VFVLVDRDAVVQLLLTVVGVYLVYAGVTALLRLTYRPHEPREKRPRRELRRFAPALVGGGLIALAVAVFVGAGGTTTAAPPGGPCNGHRELCGRPLDRVAVAATHNSMSVPLPGWYAALQEAPIGDQLNDGIHGLLIDTHYADRLPNGKLRTEFGSRSKLRQQAAQDGVSPNSVDAALRIRDRLGFAGEGERGMYLCHTFCELGGTTLASVLEDLHDFLVANPDEVVVVINQDYVTPKDFVGAVEDAGLGDLVYRGPVSGEWPTLRQAIDRGWRVLFLAEEKAGAAPWYHLTYRTITQETPYSFPTAPSLISPDRLPSTCEPNRGPDDAPLFLVNHWVTTDPLPRPSDATQVNAYDALMGRLSECRRIRKHLVNLVAVNFYRRGDVFRVVDTLNGVR